MTTTLSSLLARYSASRIRFSARTEIEYRTTISNLAGWLGRDATVADLNDESLTGFLRHRVQARSAPTARKDRAQLLTLWRWAWRKRIVEELPRDIPEVPCPRKRVRAWSPSEVAAILEACQYAPRNGAWDRRHWRALVLAIYDTAERIDALLRCPASGFDVDRRTLLIPASVRKCGKADQLATLHPETVAAIQLTFGRNRDRLFPFPGCYQTLLRHFKAILRSAGIDPKGRKVFHDLRRTSYTLTTAALGRQAASDQCGHTADLSAYYLDLGLLAELTPERRVADCIARPTSNGRR